MRQVITKSAGIQSTHGRDLRDQVTGPACTAECAGFDLATEPRPNLVVGAASADDIVAAVRFARSRDLPVGVRTTGHGATTIMNEGLLTTTRRMNQVQVDGATRTARLQSGATWDDLLDVATPLGPAPLCGAASGIGAVSYTLGGGLGHWAAATVSQPTTCGASTWSRPTASRARPPRTSTQTCSGRHAAAAETVAILTFPDLLPPLRGRHSCHVRVASTAPPADTDQWIATPCRCSRSAKWPPSTRTPPCPCRRRTTTVAGRFPAVERRRRVADLPHR
jgi:hypothetical protein